MADEDLSDLDRVLREILPLDQVTPQEVLLALRESLVSNIKSGTRSACIYMGYHGINSRLEAMIGICRDTLGVEVYVRPAQYHLSDEKLKKTLRSLVEPFAMEDSGDFKVKKEFKKSLLISSITGDAYFFHEFVPYSFPRFGTSYQSTADRLQSPSFREQFQQSLDLNRHIYPVRIIDIEVHDQSPTVSLASEIIFSYPKRYSNFKSFTSILR